MQPVLGSPVLVMFDIQIGTSANAGLTPLTPWPGVGDWETFQRNAEHTGFLLVTLINFWEAGYGRTGKQVSTVSTAGGR